MTTPTTRREHRNSRPPRSARAATAARLRPTALAVTGAVAGVATAS
ncbi:MAG: hypothetical protein JWQ19_331, partial [Subtercola sp.]|nr:hypothetical protein [Subtercola sp.]